MTRISKSVDLGRRDFLKRLGLTGSAVCLGFGGIFTMASEEKKKIIRNLEYKSTTFSVEHLPEIKEWFEKLHSENKLSNNEIYQGYISHFQYEFTQKNVKAKSVILSSAPWHILSIIFNKGGEKYEVLIPTGYTYTDLTRADLITDLKRKYNLDESNFMEPAALPLKTVAAKSGLSRYGINNIAFVDGYGSYHALAGFYTDKELPDNWGRMKTLRECRGCSICYENCPTKCIKRENFVIDVNDCVTLYNEREEQMPDHIPAEAHNTMVGCLKCQYDCPANGGKLKQIEKIAEITEEETDFILRVGDNKEIHDRLIEKLKIYPSIKNLSYFSRNLKLVLKNAKKV